MFRPRAPGQVSSSPKPSAVDVLGGRVQVGQRWMLFRDAAGASLCIVTSTAIAFTLQRFAQTADLAMIQLLGMVFVALRYDVRITLVTSFFAVAVFDFLFIPPRLAFAWSDAKNFITFSAMVGVSAVISLLNSRIREQQRVAAEAETERMRNSLLSSVSHDLKTPLSTIVAAGTTLLDREGSLSGPDSRELVSVIVMESERLSRLVQNLLAATRLESATIELHRTPEAIEELISAAVRHVRGSFASRTIDVDIPPDLPWAFVDPALVEQVVVNLLENALHYSDFNAPVRVSAHAVNQELVVQLADRGPGIPEEDVPKVFEKFYRGKTARKRDGGAGLGLTICRAVVQLHGGRIDIQNRSGGGTLVEFTLPLAQPLHAEPSQLEARA